MPSERFQKHIDRLLEQADAAVERLDWKGLREVARAALAVDPQNADANSFMAMADDAGPETGAVRLGPAVGGESVAVKAKGQPGVVVAPPAPVMPASFASGRYVVKKFLGEGGKKKVYLAHDMVLDRDVAFALIKTEALDEAARSRILREAQAMGRLGDHPKHRADS